MSDKVKYKDWLGKKVEVIIDRPLGSRHPDYPNLIYPINYGFVPETRSEIDNEEIDAYVLGPDKPIKQFNGQVIAVIDRSEDEYKLVVAKKENFTVTEIKRILSFQEKYFDSKIVMSA